MALPMKRLAENATKLMKHWTSPSATACTRFYCQQAENGDVAAAKPFDTTLLKVLVCPVSKQPLRYDQTNNELISDSLGVAYPIRNGIPNLVPQDGRILDTQIPGAKPT
ncbi:UPF0434 protein HEAR2489-like [Dreissena polymorpha]|uniref:Protein preY, mitochondrial n=1 Tax=Dreissena polymorpha TaxID=45954 RepID=A0A9D4EEM9_DREPO|nr:UPF0434 protein HEAR2489-like [Dreissena polymorpha]KAH3778298.1 hypothetical protein DPMN_179753 [Dreissena polymorpha]